MIAHAHADPTLDFLASLDDPTQWIIKRRVPVMIPHRRYDKQGKLKYTVTADDLPEIAERMQQLQAAGTPGRITPGHISDDPNFPETEQPPVIGYQLNAEVGRWGPNQKPGILVDVFIHRDRVHLAHGRPYRSAEYYPTTKEIRGLALLARDPALDMGVAEMLQSNYAEPVMADEAEVKDEAKAEEAKPELTPEEAAVADKYLEHYVRKHSWMAKCMKTYSEDAGDGASVATATNDHIPSDDLNKDKGEAERMQRDSERVNYARTEKEVAELREEVKTLRRERLEAKAERLVTQLQAENYQLDRAEEVADFVKIPESEWPAREAKIRKRYSKSSTGQKFIDTEVGHSVETLQRTEESPVTADMAGKAAVLAAQKGITYDAAIKELRTAA